MRAEPVLSRLAAGPAQPEAIGSSVQRLPQVPRRVAVHEGMPQLAPSQRPRPKARPVSPLVESDSLYLVQRIQEAFSSPSYEPPVLPAVGMELLELSRQPNVAFGAVEELLKKDPMIAARVLRVAQSARYASSAAIRSLRDALVRIGIDGMVGIFLEVVMRMRVFRAPGYEQPMARLHHHSTVTAHVAREVATLAGVPSRESFLCGLLHDVGIAACLLIIAQTTKRRRDLPTLAQAWPAVVYAHGDAGQRLCKAWRLPDSVTSVVSGHSDHHAIGQSDNPQVAVVALADSLATVAGAGLPTEQPQEQLELAAAALQFDAAMVDLLHERAANILKELGPG